MIKSLKDLLDKFSRFTNSLVYDGGICKRLTYLFFNKVNHFVASKFKLKYYIMKIIYLVLNKRVYKKELKK